MNNILDDVMKVSENISPLSVIVLLLISIVGVVLLITLCNGGLITIKKLWDKLFRERK
ncbi:MAG: hypothetical protein NC313_09065 [Butyrivibrio sp.]|nr:hypothetical protein [Butyrivibrio sp.]